MTFTVYAELAQEVSKKLDRLAKKAVGYKIPFSYTVSEEHPQEVAVREVDQVTQAIQTVSTYTVAAVNFEVECDGLIRANGWTVRAKVEHVDKGNIVTAFGGYKAKPEWFTVAPNCDHCRTNRYRGVTLFVEHEDGSVRQVGRTCLKDYTGISPATAAMWAEVQDLVDTGMDCTRSEWEARSPAQMHSVLDILAHACDAIKEFGYRKSAEPNSTRDMVTERVLSCKDPSVGGLAQAEVIRDWLVERSEKVSAENAELTELWNLYCADGNDSDERYWSRAREINYAWDAVGDLERNCFPLVLSGYAELNHIGRLAYMPVAYDRYIERLARKAQQKADGARSEPVGTVGQRITLKAATVVLLTSWDGYYGTTWLYKFVDESGNVFIWYASRPCAAKDGATIKATVKDHGERDGVKQTIVTRCCVAA